jgi:hypothetical protein
VFSSAKSVAPVFTPLLPSTAGITKRKKIKKLKQRTVACVQPLPINIGTKLQKTLTTHRMLGVLIFKKVLNLGQGKKS